MTETTIAQKLPLTLDDLTREWVQAALAGCFPGVSVSAFRVAEVLPGSATKVWLELEYAEGGPELPGTLVMKTGFDPVMRALAAPVYERESLFFARIAPTLDLVLPRCFFAATDRDSGQSALLLEDLCARGCGFGRIFEPLDAGTVARTLDYLARLHAAYWGRTDVQVLEGFDRNEGRFAVCDFLLGEDNWSHCMALPRARDIPGSIRNRERVARALVHLRTYDRQGPLCLIHGDAHLGNMYFEPDGAPRFLDWQAAMTGSWDQDVAYFITCALTTDDRRSHERMLLAHYLERLNAHGVVHVPRFEDAWEAYRRQVAYGILGLLCTPQMQTEEFAGIMGLRFARAMDDLGSLDVLEIPAS